MADSEASYSPTRSPDSAGSSEMFVRQQPAAIGLAGPATASNIGAPSPALAKPSPSASSIEDAQDTRRFNYPVPRPQIIPPVHDLEDDLSPRTLWSFFDLHRSLENSLDDDLRDSPLIPKHFDQSTVLHTLFFIKKVATIQCDSCDGKGRGEETYKCAQCVKQICRQCMEAFLAREAAANKNDKNAYKWNWQGEYRHEGLKQCYVARKAAQSTGNFQVDISVSLLGLESPDTVTVHLIHGNHYDEDSLLGNKRPRSQPESGSDKTQHLDQPGDSPESTPSKRPRTTPKKPVRKTAAGSDRPPSAAETRYTNERTRQELSPNVARTLYRITTAAIAAADNQSQNRNTSPPSRSIHNTSAKTEVMSSNRFEPYALPSHGSAKNQNVRRSQRQQPTQPFQTGHNLPPQTQQYAQPQPPAQYQQQMLVPATIPVFPVGPTGAIVHPPPLGTRLMIPQPFAPDEFREMSWEQWQIAAHQYYHTTPFPQNTAAGGNNHGALDSQPTQTGGPTQSRFPQNTTVGGNNHGALDSQPAKTGGPTQTRRRSRMRRSVETSQSDQARTMSNDSQLSTQTIQESFRCPYPPGEFPEALDLVHAGGYREIGDLGRWFGVLLPFTTDNPNPSMRARTTASAAITFGSLESYLRDMEQTAPSGSVTAALNPPWLLQLAPQPPGNQYVPSLRYRRASRAEAEARDDRQQAGAQQSLRALLYSNDDARALGLPVGPRTDRDTFEAQQGRNVPPTSVSPRTRALLDNVDPNDNLAVPPSAAALASIAAALPPMRPVAGGDEDEEMMEDGGEEETSRSGKTRSGCDYGS